MPYEFLFWPGIHYCVPRNTQWGRHLRVLNGVTTTGVHIELDPREPPAPKHGDPRYDADVRWLVFPPVQVIVHIEGSAAKLEGLPDGCVPIAFDPNYVFTRELSKTAQRYAKKAHGKVVTGIRVKRGNMPLLCVEGTTVPGSQGDTYRDGIITEWPAGRGRIPASTMYVPLSRPTGLNVLALLEPLPDDALRRLYVPPDVVANSRRLTRLAAITRVRNLLPDEVPNPDDEAIAAAPVLATRPGPAPPSTRPRMTARERDARLRKRTRAAAQPSGLAQTRRSCAEGVAATIAHRARRTTTPPTTTAATSEIAIAEPVPIAPNHATPIDDASRAAAVKRKGKNVVRRVF